MTEKNLVDSLKKRYFYKLNSNLISIPIGMITLSIIPRMLGPENYGNYYYLIFIFTQITGFFNVGNTFFATRLAENFNNEGIKRFFFNFIGLFSSLLIILLIIASLFKINSIFFPEQKLLFIWMALFFTLGLTLQSNIKLILDVYGLTVKGETIFILGRIISVVILLIIYWSNRHNIFAVFIYNYITIAIIIFGWTIIFKKNNISLYPSRKIAALNIKSYIKKFYDYASPLYSFACIAIFIDIFIRWLLQIFGGSVEQGYFSISDRTSAVIILFSTSLTPLLLREFSISMGEDSIEKIKLLFQRVIPMFYSIAAFFCVFIILQANKVVLFIGGKEFTNAKTPLAIMALYPMFYTTMGILYTLLFSTRQTKLYRNLGIFTRVLNLPIFFFLIAPKKYMGFNLGAIGYATGMVLVTFLSYNIYLWFCTKYLKLSFMKYFFHQFYSVSLLGLAAFISIYISNTLWFNSLMSFLASGFLYIIETIILTVLFPNLFHVSKDEIIKLLKFKSSH